MIVFENVRLKYSYDEFELFKGVSFAIDNDVNTILCDTQSGKTSLCRLLCKDIHPTSGNILVDKKSLNSITLLDLGILYLPNKPTFFESRSLLYNVAYPLKVRKVNKKERIEKATTILKQFGMEDVKHKVSQLSNEERKIIALARGLTIKRNIVIFDDFFDNVEEMELIFEKFGDATKIVVTSNVNFASGYTVVLDGGVTVFQGDVVNARSCVDGLNWLYNKLRRDNG